MKKKIINTVTKKYYRLCNLSSCASKSTYTRTRFLAKIDNHRKEKRKEKKQAS